MSSFVERAVGAVRSVGSTFCSLSSHVYSMMTLRSRPVDQAASGSRAPKGRTVSRRKRTGRKAVARRTGGKEAKQPQQMMQPSKRRKTTSSLGAGSSLDVVNGSLSHQMESSSSSGGVRTRSMVRRTSRQLHELPDEILSMILSYLPLLDQIISCRVDHKFQRLINDQLSRQSAIGIVCSFTSLYSYPNPLFYPFFNPECDDIDHRVSTNHIITSKQFLNWTGRRMCIRMPRLKIIKFDDEIDGRAEMREAEIMLNRCKNTITCFHFPALQLKHHNLLAKNLVHLSIHSMCMDQRGGGGGSGRAGGAATTAGAAAKSGPASILRTIRVLRCKEMCPKVFKRLPNGLISLKTDTHGRNFINHLLKSPATQSLEVMKVTNFYSQSIDSFSIPRLKYLSIQGYFVHDTSTQFLRSLSASTELQHLKLQFFTEIRQNQFPQFIKISADEWIRFLSRLRCVESLEIWASLVNDAVVKCIVDRLSHLKSLILHWSCLTDTGLSHLSDMSHLVTCKVMSEDNEISADAIIAFVDKQRNTGLISLSIKTKSSLSGQDERLQEFLTNVLSNSNTLKQIQICCIRQQQTYRLF